MKVEITNKACVQETILCWEDVSVEKIDEITEDFDEMARKADYANFVVKISFEES